MNIAEFDTRINEYGWVIFHELVDHKLIIRMQQDIEKAYKRCRAIQLKNKIPENNDYTVHHLVGHETSFFDYLEECPISEYITRYFNSQYILNSFGGAINTSGSMSYAHNIHRDIRTYSNDLPLLLNTLVMLDDFTEENGATWLLSGSHKQEKKPSQSYFDKNAEQAIAKAGSILFFNSNVWHAGGNNISKSARRSLTPMYSKPFIKQQLDYPRAIGYPQKDALSSNMQQILGYNSRTPESLDEWYQAPTKRMYKKDQG
jgi:hypothetical protein